MNITLITVGKIKEKYFFMNSWWLKMLTTIRDFIRYILKKEPAKPNPTINSSPKVIHNYSFIMKIFY